ncbi:MAG TPA: hypothetical protein VGR38_01140 [Candidatus Polarisedimenticolia bacterium]|jgi:hypothetical protein|nr:hypothetical protein [Candidatus Polarisedimenticolia bacterium]
MRRPGGFGFLIALAALIVVLFLSMKAWKSAFPAAVQAIKPGTAQAVPDHGDKEAGDAIRSRKLPDMKTMGQRTDAHVQQIQDAAKNQD